MIECSREIGILNYFFANI